MRGRSYTAKVVDRDVVGRPCGKKESTVEPLLAASGRCYCSSSYFCLSSRSPRPGLFIPLSVTASLSFATSSLFLSFCPFSASANDSRLFIPRLCIARERARALLRLLTTAVPSAASVLLRRYFASLPFAPSFCRSFLFLSLFLLTVANRMLAKHQRRGTLLTNTERCARCERQYRDCITCQREIAFQQVYITCSMYASR